MALLDTLSSRRLKAEIEALARDRGYSLEEHDDRLYLVRADIRYAMEEGAEGVTVARSSLLDDGWSVRAARSYSNTEEGVVGAAIDLMKALIRRS